MAKHRDPSMGVNGEMPALAWEFAREVQAREVQAREVQARRAGGETRNTRSGRTRKPFSPNQILLGLVAADAERAFASETARLRRSISAAVRAGRGALNLSQRELARRAGVSQSTVARLESDAGDPTLATAVSVLAAIGERLTLERPVEPTRSAGEYARDRQGRRLPAHLHPYRLQQPHSWWPGITNILMWHDEPKWSYRRR